MVCLTVVVACGGAGGHPQGAGQLFCGCGRRQGSCGTLKASAWVSGYDSARDEGFRKKL